LSPFADAKEDATSAVDLLKFMLVIYTFVNLFLEAKTVYQKTKGAAWAPWKEVFECCKKPT